MASIRRTLSPVPRPGALVNGEACQVASPLSKSSSNSQNYAPHGGPLLGSLDYALYKAQNLILGILSQRSSRSFDRAKVKGQTWRRAFLHFLMCFVAGVFVGLTPLVSLNSTINVLSKNQPFDFEVLQSVGNSEFYGGNGNETSVLGRPSLHENSVSVPHGVHAGLKDGILDHAMLSNSFQASSHSFHKLLIIVTPILSRPLQTYYLNRLSRTLKLVPHPLLWIVVEMDSPSVETSELLRNTGLMYRHLVCSIKNSTGTMDRKVLLRNVAISHIEKHRLDGIVYFADDDRIYSVDLFEQMRQISRFGTWTVAKLGKSEGNIVLEGPICNGSQMIGWHMVDVSKRFRRFHADMAGFAFNSTIIWDPKRWHRSSLEPIRQLETAREGFQASTFIEQIVEDESQMECFSMNSPGILVWHHSSDLNSYPQNWFKSSNLGTVVPLT